MSPRSASHQQASEPYGQARDRHDDDRHAHRAAHRHIPHDEPPRADPAPRRHPATQPRRPAQQKDYTLLHAGRQVRIGPVAFWTCVGTLVIMAGWSAVTATYFAFHDDVLTRLIARQAEMQFAYEDRIAEMRGQVDRVTSRQLLDQDQFERRLDQLFKRQAALEARASSLGALADPAVTGAIKPNARSPGAGDSPAAPPKPSPISDKAVFAAPPDREARFELRGAAPSASRRMAAATSGGLEGALAGLQDSLDRVEARQTWSLNTLEESYDTKVKRMRGVLAELGLGRTSEPPSGGPFLPYRLASSANAFERQVHRISVARAQADKLTRTMSTVPIRKPVTGEIDMTSSFGVRIDPFLGRPAMHTGIDFHGTQGDPIRATASGTVTLAGWNGGYGRLVEVDHGNGLATRYGHLSEIDVTIGQTIKIGQIVGRLGSTGRSTGPHLHYETRIDGEAVDPQKFLRAGIRMGSFQ